MLSTFIYIIVTWFALGFVTAWLFGYSGRTAFQAGLLGLIAGLLILASILTFSPRMSRVFWENLREDEEAMFWFGLYFATPIVLLGLGGILWLIVQILAFLADLL